MINVPLTLVVFANTATSTAANTNTNTNNTNSNNNNNNNNNSSCSLTPVRLSVQKRHPRLVGDDALPAVRLQISLQQTHSTPPLPPTIYPQPITSNFPVLGVVRTGERERGGSKSCCRPQVDTHGSVYKSPIV